MNERIGTAGEEPQPVTAGLPRLQARVLRAVEGQRAFLRSGGGCGSWWQVRQALGGPATRNDVRAAVDALLAAGSLVEVWLVVRNGRRVPHALCLPEQVGSLTYPVGKAAGRPELLARLLPGLRSTNETTV